MRYILILIKEQKMDFNTRISLAESYANELLKLCELERDIEEKYPGAIKEAYEFYHNKINNEFEYGIFSKGEYPVVDEVIDVHCCLSININENNLFFNVFEEDGNEASYEWKDNKWEKI